VWKCDNCGADVDDEFVQCWNCDSLKDGTKLEVAVDKEASLKESFNVDNALWLSVNNKEELEDVLQELEITFDRRVKFFLILIMFTILLCLPWSLNLIAWLYFPGALWGLVGQEATDEALLYGWFFYLLSGVSTLCIKKESLFKLCFIIITLILILNIAGCHMTAVNY